MEPARICENVGLLNLMIGNRNYEIQYQYS